MRSLGRSLSLSTIDSWRCWDGCWFCLAVLLMDLYFHRFVRHKIVLHTFSSSVVSHAHATSTHPKSHAPPLPLPTSRLYTTGGGGGWNPSSHVDRRRLGGHGSQRERGRWTRMGKQSRVGLKSGERRRFRFVSRSYASGVMTRVKGFRRLVTLQQRPPKLLRSLTDLRAGIF